MFGHQFFVLLVGSDRVEIARRPGSLVERRLFDEEGKGVHLGIWRGDAGTARARRMPAWNAASATGGALAGVDGDDGRSGRLLVSQLTVTLSTDHALVIVIVR